MNDGNRLGHKFFDLHCDTITQCMEQGCGLTGNHLHISLERFPAQDRLIQCMAVFVPDTLRGPQARDYYHKAVGTFRQQLAQHADLAAQVRDPEDLERVLDEKQFAFLLTVEGGHALGGRLEALEELYRDGVRMMTLTWNAANELCGGAATDEGFTDFGRAAVARMEALGMVVDVSHLSDRGFWQLCGFADRPFVASHSGARAVCGHRRNLDDDMIRETVGRGGLIGLNFYQEFLRDGGDAGMDDLLRHVFHFLELGARDVLALGSDYDGAEIPDCLRGFEKLPAVAEALERAGIPDEVCRGILFDNANRFFCKQLTNSKACGGVTQ